MRNFKVYFGTTTKEITKYKDYYFAIRKELIDLGCIITDDWLPSTYDWMVSNPNGYRGKAIFQQIIENINHADFVVIEYTVPNFSSSHQILHASMKRKPVLVLRMKEDNTFSDSYLEWIDSPFLTLKEYSLDNLNTIIKEFLGEVQIGHGFKRYNLVLENKHKHFLDWATEKYKKSRSELVRDSLDKVIENNNDYLDYLRS